MGESRGGRIRENSTPTHFLTPGGFQGGPGGAAPAGQSLPSSSPRRASPPEVTGTIDPTRKPLHGALSAVSGRVQRRSPSAAAPIRTFLPMVSETSSWRSSSLTRTRAGVHRR
jgi:hypothetical protein